MNALKKGHRDFVTIVTARLADGQLVVLGVLADREKSTVSAFLRSIPQRLCRTIHTVCCDMYAGFTKAVREELQTARIVVDRFHITCHYQKAADGMRQSELKRLKQELLEVVMGFSFGITCFSASTWIWRATACSCGDRHLWLCHDNSL